MYDGEGYPEDLRKHLVGKKITAIKGETFTLDDGMTLELGSASDCCAWFEASVEALDFEDNIITAVQEVDDEGRENASWTVHVLSRDKVLARVEVDGDPSSGYYCHSVYLKVQVPHA